MALLRLLLRVHGTAWLPRCCFWWGMRSGPWPMQRLAP